MTHTTALPLIFFLAAVFLQMPAEAQDSLRIAAVVNDEVISVYDLESRLSLVMASSQIKDDPRARKRLAPRILRNLIDERLKLQEANRLNIRVTKQNIDRALLRIEEQNNLPKGGLDSFLRRSGINKPVLIEQIEADIAWSKVVSRKFSSSIMIGDDEIDEALAKITANKGKPEYRVSEIYLPLDNQQDEGEVLALAGRLAQQIRNGADFQAVARTFSQSASAAVGGDLGWIKQEQLGGKLDEAINRLQPGEISSPIQSMLGYHILLLRKRRIDQGLPVPDITVSLWQLFIPIPPGTAQHEVEGQIELARTMSEVAVNCQDMERLGKESGSGLSGNLGRINTSKLPPNIRDAVKDLPTNKASSPLRINEGLVVLMVCDREGGDSVTAERDRLRQTLMMERLEIAARRFLRDLRGTAFVDIRV